MSRPQIAFRDSDGPRSSASRTPRPLKIGVLAFVLAAAAAVLPLSAKEKDPTQLGAGFIINVPFTEAEVAQVVEDVANDGIIRGTKEYNKDQYVSGANLVDSTKVFPAWTEGGKVFYKVRLRAIDPRNFKDSNDVGTLAVRYVVKAQNAKNTVLRINAIFVEDFRKVAHQSDGSVETAEYKDIHDRLDQLALMKSETADAERIKQARAGGQQPSAAEESSSSSTATHELGVLDRAPAPSPAASTTSAAHEATPALSDQPPVESATAQAQPAEVSSAQALPPQTLEERVRDLRRQVQRVVKAPGAPLKSAPFHTASTLQSLPAGTEILIVITTPYWFGVETHEGEHGWMLRDDLEIMP